MEAGDPFGWIMEACQVSSSEESRLRRCSYFGQSDSDDSDSDCRNPSDIPVASTGITMVSHPESPQDELPNDLNTLLEDKEIFHTPPEYRSTSTSFVDCNDERMIGDELDRDGETVSIDADSADSLRAVDLGRDTDLGFSEMEVDSTQKIEANSNGTFSRESEEIKVSKRGYSPKGKLSTESSSKKLRSFYFESPSARLETPKLLKSFNLKTVSPSPGYNSELEQKTERKRALPSWAYGRVKDDEIADEELEVNETELPSWANRRVGMMRELTRNWMLMHGDTHSDGLSESSEEIMVLDLLLDLKNVTDSESEERNMDTENNNGEGSSSRGTFGRLLDVLVKLEEDSEEGRNLECLSLLEVAERIRVHFPRSSDRSDRSQEGSKVKR